MLVFILLLHIASSFSSVKQQVIQDNLALIQQWNQASSSDGAVFAPNKFIGLSEQEMRDLLNIRDIQLNIPADKGLTEQQGVGQGPPSSFDWRHFGAVTSPRNSVAGGGPFLAAAVSTIESAYYRCVQNNK